MATKTVNISGINVLLIKLYSQVSPYDFEYGWMIEGTYSPKPVYSEGEAIASAKKFIAENFPEEAATDGWR